MLNESDFEMKILEEFINWTFRFAVKTSVKEELFDVFSIYFRITKKRSWSFVMSKDDGLFCFQTLNFIISATICNIALLLRNKSARGKF